MLQTNVGSLMSGHRCTTATKYTTAPPKSEQSLLLLLQYTKVRLCSSPALERSTSLSRREPEMITSN